MATVGRRRSITSSLGRSSRDQSLAAPPDKALDKARDKARDNARDKARDNARDQTLSKSTSTSALSVASDTPADSHDGALDRLRSRNSDDARSDSSSHNHKRRLSGLFKRRKRSDTAKPADSRDDLSQLDPDKQLPAAEPRNYSDDSLGLHKSVASSLLTDDSDSEPS